MKGDIIELHDYLGDGDSQAHFVFVVREGSPPHTIYVGNIPIEVSDGDGEFLGSYSIHRNYGNSERI
jgi:hypothetical protein